MASQLVRLGGDINQQNANGQTPLEVANQHGHANAEMMDALKPPEPSEDNSSHNQDLVQAPALEDSLD